MPRYDTRDPELRRRAEKMGVPFFVCENVNDESFVETIRRMTPDILVSMSFNQILKDPILQTAPMGFINCHAGALPFYRGRNPLNWALINGEKNFGVTVHHIDEGIDTGDIIRQDFVDIAETDTYETLLEKAFAQCPLTLMAALSDLEAGAARRIPQSTLDPVGFYCGRRREGDEWIDWNWTSERIFNFIRALTPPGPGARCQPEGTPTRILGSRKIPQAPAYLATPGEVLGRTKDGVVVKTGDTTLLLTCAATLDPAAQPFIPRWTIGTRLSIDPMTELTRLQERVHRLEQALETRSPAERRVS